MRKLKIAVVENYDFTSKTMPVLFAIEHYGSYPIPDKSKKPIYSDIFYDSKSSLVQAGQKRKRKKSILENS